jgi:hypothetical protein
VKDAGTHEGNLDVLQDVPKESKQSRVDPYEGRVVDSGIKGSSDATTCSRSPSQPVVLNAPPGARRERLAESMGSATVTRCDRAKLRDKLPFGFNGCFYIRIFLIYKRIRRPQ